MPRILFREENSHDHVSDFAFAGRPDCDRHMGGRVVSAEIIPFVPRINRKRESMRSPSIAFRPPPRRDDLTMDHADTAPCEYVSSLDMPGHDLKNG
jgi:hypothetical protein